MSQDRDASSSQAPRPKNQEAGRAAPSASASLPSVSLPKGGGAIRGLGEKFGVNPATGTGSLSVPLASSPGRSDFGPQLSLSYDSGSGNGPFGLGWSLSVPAITRKTDKGLPRYLDGDESDVFLVSGAEDLVPILDSGRNRISFLRTLHNVAYRVHLYRPRIEGMFARIERWTRADNAVSHWRTITRDNVTTLFGVDDNSRIRDPNDERRIFSYLISLSFDDKGNATQYRYAIDDLAGINRAAAHEANRTDDDRQTQRYLKSIHYGNSTPYFADWSETGAATPLPTTWHFQIVFDYGDHRTEAPTPVRDPAVDPVWPIRPDPWSVFRAGFEVRTYRRCERVLLFHQFPGQAEFEQPYLIRSTDFRYSDETAPADPRNPVYTFIESINQTGYRRKAIGYDQRSTPALEFVYSQSELQQEVLTLDSADSRENLPEGLAGSRFQWVDLNGEGLSGILTDQDGGWSYKRNLSPINRVQLPSGKRVTRASFGPSEQVLSVTVPFRPGSGQQLLDLTGEGRPDLVGFDVPVPGYFARTIDESWEPLKTFKFLPRLNWSEPNLKFVDLTGDGRADALITEDDVYTFYPSLGVEGFGEAERVATHWDEERGPRVVFADGTQTVSLADLSGDGLSDIVRVRNGEVCYWPNLGYGRFGAKVSMDNAPRFAAEEQFDPRRVHFADIDGSGTTDLLYVGFDGVQVCFNRSGNSWADSHVLAVFPGADNLGSIQVTDLLGNGTASLVWSSPLPGEAYSSLRYVDLMGSQKPHLMVQTKNNLGAETRVAYAPSTRFYLEDKRAGRPWITRLPFPVHVVERLEIYDWIGRSRFVTRYAYHHGYFDGEEREFRGFGMIEQWDTETHRDDTLFPEVETANEDAASFVPPRLTKRWFHNGVFVEAGAVSRQYAHEYWIEPALRADNPAAVAAREAMLLPDTVIEKLEQLDAGELREAYRALKGSALRIETYSKDGTSHAEHPYTVTEENLAVRRLQARGPNQHGVFLTHTRESVTYHYERQPDDPRVTHDLTLEVDDFGNVKRSVSIGYPRRGGYPEPEPDLSAGFRAMLAHDQTQLHIGAIEHVFTIPVNDLTLGSSIDDYRAPLTSEKIDAEFTGITAPAGLFRFADFDGVNGVGGFWITLWGGAHDIPYEEVSTLEIEGVGAPAGLSRRIVEHVRTVYRKDNLTSLLALGLLEPNALPGESYRLALTASLISRIFEGRVLDGMLTEGGYLRPPGETAWWIPDGRLFYSPGDADTPDTELAEARAHFYQVRRARDPFGAIRRVSYDAYDLLPATTSDGVGNVTTAHNDYRVLRPFRSIDPNGNRKEVAFDCLGRVAGSAASGPAGEGDSLVNFTPDLSESEIEAVLDDPLGNPAVILGNATSRTIYDAFSYFRTRLLPAPNPPTIYILTRDTHVSEITDPAAVKFHHLFIYSDGFGHEAQHKAPAEPGPIPPIESDVSPRWIGSGWKIYNNKEKPVRQYEPFFSNTHHFEFNRQAGVSSVLCYDPMDRVIAILHPDNTFEKTVFDAWRQETWDANDNSVPVTDPRTGELVGDALTDPVVGPFFRRLFGNAPGAFVSWHERRIAGLLGDSPAERSANQDAAQKTAAHAGTPAVAHFDSLGRKCLTLSDNGIQAGVPQRYPVRNALDTRSKPLAVFDAGGKHVMEFCLREPLGGGFRYVAGYDMAGNTLYRNGMDGGERRTLNDILGSPFYTWDARGFVFRVRYDAQRRPTHRFVAKPLVSEMLMERFVYGEHHASADRNLKGRLFRHYDGAGVIVNERYDFKGNLLESTRQFARHNPPSRPAAFYQSTPDWSVITDITESPVLDVGAIETATGSLLNASDRFVAFSKFDAVNRVIQTVAPHAAGARPSVIQQTFNEANLLEKVDVWVRRAAAPASLLDPATADTHAITDIDYDARGRKVRVAHDNGAVTTWVYDAETFRLKKTTTTRPHADLDARTLQELFYAYDGVGNITRLRDTADIQNVVYFRNQRVEPSADYTYDAIYRLVHATGREHLGQTADALNSPQQVTNDDSFRMRLGAPGARGDGKAMGNYTEQYKYDSVGNLTDMIHQVASGSWTRRYSYAAASAVTPAEFSNRLSATSMPGDSPTGPFSATYDYDPHGNLTRMPHLPRLTWDEWDCLQSTTRQDAGLVMPETTYYCYDADGERQRKATFWSSPIDNPPRIKAERLYLGPLEIYREYDAGGNLTKERETLHVVDDMKKIVIVETRTLGTDPAPEQIIRYQFCNHVSSSMLELDSHAEVISYEEYFPFGSTSYQAVRSQTETPKRYRYTDKERDEESELAYHGARYYAPWLGRWTACDPIGTADHINLYVYVRNNPIVANDPTGKWTWRQVGIVALVVTVAVVVTVATAGVGAAAVGAAAGAAGTAFGATGAVVATVATTVVVGAATGAAAGAASDLTAQALTNPRGQGIDWRRVGAAAAGGGAAGGALSIIPGLSAARAVGQAVRTGATAAQVARAATVAARGGTAAAGSLGRQVVRATARGIPTGAAGGAVHEGTRQVVSGERSARGGFDYEAIGVSALVGGGAGAGGAALGTLGRAAGQVIRARIAPLANVFRGPGQTANQGYTGVYDEATGNIRLRPSTAERVAPNQVPPGWVNRAGGHADVSAELGGNPAGHHGFSAHLQQNGTLELRWRSGQLNPPPSNEVPAAIRPRIANTVERQAGRLVTRE